MPERIFGMLNDGLLNPIIMGFLCTVGLYYTIKCKFFQIVGIREWFSETILKSFRRRENKSKVTPFAAMTAVLAGTMGTGNIVGVATAITSGGAGAVFWMIAASFLSMMTAYAESFLGIWHCRVGKNGKIEGSPMVYLEKCTKSRFLGNSFAFFCILASFAIGNMTQANSLASAAEHTFGITPMVTSMLLMALTAVVIWGGLSRIVKFTQAMIPAMSLFYLIGALFIIIVNHKNIPATIELIFTEAFGLREFTGGIAGFTVAKAIRMGVARGVLSNEAGLGSAVLVHCEAVAADELSNSEKRRQAAHTQGMWGIFEVFFDTVITCTITAVALLVSGACSAETDGAQVALDAFRTGFGDFGSVFLSIALIFFAFSSIVGWSYYGSKCSKYLFGEKSVTIYKMLYIAMLSIGCTASLLFVWGISDVLGALMALPNLIGLVLLRKDVQCIGKNKRKS